MRADRLVAILNLLQVRGQVTAQEISEELEISERTARRDLEALGQAGVPDLLAAGAQRRVAARRRRQDRPVGSHRRRDARPVSRRRPVVASSPAVRAAVRKLVRALPEPFREAADATRNASLFDRGWDGDAPRVARTPPLLDEAQRCVVEGRQVSLDYVARDGSATTRVDRSARPRVQGRALVHGRQHRQAACARSASTASSRSRRPASRVARPDGFDLDDAWQLITDAVEDMRMPIVVVASIDAGDARHRALHVRRAHAHRPDRRRRARPRRDPRPPRRRRCRARSPASAPASKSTPRPRSAPRSPRKAANWSRCTARPTVETVHVGDRVAGRRRYGPDRPGLAIPDRAWCADAVPRR